MKQDRYPEPLSRAESNVLSFLFVFVSLFFGWAVLAFVVWCVRRYVLGGA